MFSPIAKLMERFGAAPTRENYLNFAYLGKPPADTTELEDTMPENFRLPTREYDKLDATKVPQADPENLSNAKATYNAVRGMSRR